MHPLLRYVLVATPLCAVVFLVSSGFFSAWDGRVVSHRASPEADPAALRVLVVADDGAAVEQDWPADVVRELGVKVDNTGFPPSKLPDGAPLTNKPRFATFFTVTKAGEDAKVVHPPLVGPLSLALLLWVGGLGLHNMLRSGSPFSWEPKGVDLPVPQPHGVSAPPPPGSSTPRRPQPGPPPPRQRVGRGRRG